MTIVPVSDSARACLKVGRQFLACTGLSVDRSGAVARFDGVVSLHCVCLMHQVALVVSALLKMLDVTCPMFCASVLMQSGATRHCVTQHASAHLKAQVKIVYRSDDDGGTQRLLEAVFDELGWLDPDSDAALFPSADTVDAERSKRHSQKTQGLSPIALCYSRGILHPCCGTRTGVIDVWRELCHADLRNV